LNKLIHIIPSIAEESSGPTYSVKRLVESLINIKLDVELATLNINNSKLPEYASSFDLVGNKRLASSPLMYRWLNNKVKIHNKNIIFHNHGMWQFNSLYPGQIANKYKIPYVVSTRGSFSKIAFKNGSLVKKIFWPLYQKPSFKSVSLFHATSFDEYLDIRSLGFKQPIAIIPNGIDIPNKFLKINSIFKTVLFLGRIHPIKGLDLLLPAWKLIQDKHTDWQLKIIGDDIGYHGSTGYKLKLKSISNYLKLKRVEFIDPLYGNEKWQAYKDADIYVLPSYSENFGVTIAEAMASGLPVIVTKGTPWSEVEENNAGLWIDNNIEAIAYAIETLINKNTKDRELMGQNGKEWMVKDFSWDTIAKKMNCVYDWLENPNTNLLDFVQQD
jgi:glycosyltransferase involved in cell wall biosynthesis